MDEKETTRKGAKECKTRKNNFHWHILLPFSWAWAWDNENWRKEIFFCTQNNCSFLRLLRSSSFSEKTKSFILWMFYKNLNICVSGFLIAFFNLQPNISRMDIAINAIQHANRVEVQPRTIVLLAPTICCYKTTNVSAAAIKDSSWRLEYARNVCTHALSVFLAWTAQNASKDCSYKAESVEQRVLMGKLSVRSSKKVSSINNPHLSLIRDNNGLNFITHNERHKLKHYEWQRRWREFYFI